MPPQTNTANTPSTSPAPFFLDGQYHGLGRKALYLHIIQKSAIAICILFVEIVLLAVVSSGSLNQIVRTNPQLVPLINGLLTILFFAFILALLLGIIIGYFAYKSFRYRVDENGFSTERGITSKQETSLPYHQISNVEIQQSALYRLFGLCDMVITTETREESSVTSKNDSEIIFNALELATARDLQRYLIERSNIQEINRSPVMPPPIVGAN